MNIIGYNIENTSWAVNITNNTQNKIASTVGSYIAELRKDAGLTQKQLADNLHLSKRTILHFEQGLSIPTTTILLSIADYFNVNVDYLLGRCKSNFKYTTLNEAFTNQVSVGSVITRLLKLDQSDRKYIMESLKIMERSLNKK